MNILFLTCQDPDWRAQLPDMGELPTGDRPSTRSPRTVSKPPNSRNHTKIGRSSLLQICADPSQIRLSVQSPTWSNAVPALDEPADGSRRPQADQRRRRPHPSLCSRPSRPPRLRLFSLVSLCCFLVVSFRISLFN
ncbi:hypothetical protein PYCCODRAFT_1068085 [Trametes coccinea BRFM310]|uniref:Uncharacterized protein n=1 Tax=Trametes coccinea (strain BRFM310) TaxID=1353009 RepID=A0A1Y2IY46_TRAC3|nr:hypothetical protein PYCCODRAFT_1068085 [Trametes coccinea BRFM310]